MDSFAVSPVVPNGQTFLGNLREEADEKQQLEKSNFDLKMKVYYLEENLRKLSSQTALGEDTKGDVTSLKLQLEEKTIELEQRNLLLLKAKGAIEGLKGEVKRLKTESGKSEDLEERVRALKQSNDNMEAEYRMQLTRLEHQLATTRQALTTNDQQRIAIDERAVRKK